MCACATSPKLIHNSTLKPKTHIREHRIKEHHKTESRIQNQVSPKHTEGARDGVPPPHCGSQASGPSALFDHPKRGSPVQFPCACCVRAGLRLYGLPYTYEILTLHTIIIPIKLTSSTSVALPAPGGSLFCATLRRTIRNHPARAIGAMTFDVGGHFAKWFIE